MTFGLIDVLLLICLSGFVFYGLFFGLIRMTGVFLGTIVGAIVASRLYLSVSSILSPLFFGYENLGKVVVFLLLFSLINKLVGFGFMFVEKVFNLISIIPFLKTINRFAGGVLGFFTGSMTIGLVLYFVSKYAVLDFFIGTQLVDSKLAPVFLFFNKIILPLLPEVLKKIQSLI